jgi:hypothetical protein
MLQDSLKFQEEVHFWMYGDIVRITACKDKEGKSAWNLLDTSM